MVENDANCVALSEARLGCKKKNFIVLTIGTGIGGGVIIDGRLYIGQGYAAELGHVVIKEGKESNQGIGYLDDGTMIVVEDGKNKIGERLSVIVTSILQTTAGRMIFTKVK